MRRKALWMLPVGLMLLAGAMAYGQTESKDGAKTSVKLLDPGTGPRTALRYKFQANQTQKVVMDMSMSMSMEIGELKQPELKLPGTRMTMTIVGKELTPKGDLHYEFDTEKVEVVAGPGVNPAIADAMKEQVSKMEGLKGSATVSPRGFTKEAKIETPPGMDAQSKQLMESMTQSMDQISALFPEEPVGRGARWQVTMPMETAQMKLTQVATYTLSDIEGDKAKLDVKLEQTAPAQDIAIPGGAPGMKVSLESLESSGTGTVELDVTKLVPTATTKLKSTHVMSAGDQKFKTTMQMEMKIHP